MIIDEAQPTKILAFDATKRPVAEPVDLDSPFFTVTHPEYPACNHRERGVTLDTGTRRAICKCGEVIDSFDALLIYAHAQQRLQDTRQFIEDDRRREAEKKAEALARKPCGREVGGFCATYDRRQRINGWSLSLVGCGHTQHWPKQGRKRHPPRSVTCLKCVHAEKLKAAGVALVEAQAQA